MSIRMSASLVIVLLALLTITEGMSLRGVGADLRCRCIETESRRIGRLIKKVEMFPPSSHCRDTEIIATLSNSGQEICLDVSAPWVKRVIKKMLANNKWRRGIIPWKLWDSELLQDTNQISIYKIDRLNSIIFYPGWNTILDLKWHETFLNENISIYTQPSTMY